MRQYEENNQQNDFWLKMDTRAVITLTFMYAAYCMYNNFQQRRRHNGLDMLSQMRQDVQQVPTYIQNAPGNAVNFAVDELASTLHSLRNIIMQIKSIIMYPSLTNAFTLVTWVHCLSILLKDDFLFYGAFSRLDTKDNLKYYLHLWPVLIMPGIPMLLAINTISGMATDYIFSEVPNFLRRVRHRGFGPIREFFTLPNTIAIAATLCRLPTDINILPLTSPLVFFGFILMRFQFVQILTENIQQQVIGKLAGYARFSYHYLWKTLGYQRAQPVSPHDFSNMDTEELTCPISYNIPEPDDAVVIANDPHRQVYSETTLKQWINQSTTPQNIQGKFYNVRTQSDCFTENDIIPAPETVKEQIRTVAQDNRLDL